MAERWKEVTGNSIVEGYGLTECSPIVTMNPVDVTKPMPVFTGSIGLPAPSTEVRIRRDDGLGQRGRAQVSCACVALRS